MRKQAALPAEELSYAELARRLSSIGRIFRVVIYARLRRAAYFLQVAAGCSVSSFMSPLSVKSP
jgi:hypothetical protein